MAAKKRLENRHYVESFNLPGKVTNFIIKESEKSDRSASSQLTFYLRNIMTNYDAFMLMIDNSTVNSNNIVNSQNRINKEKSINNLNVDAGASVNISISDSPKSSRK